jgi:hypothetical protein
MAKPARATQEKRKRERDRQERKAEKREVRAKRKEERGSRPRSLSDGEDPDLAGIIPGPQPRIDEA